MEILTRDYKITEDKNTVYINTIYGEQTKTIIRKCYLDFEFTLPKYPIGIGFYTYDKFMIYCNGKVIEHKPPDFTLEKNSLGIFLMKNPPVLIKIKDNNGILTEVNHNFYEPLAMSLIGSTLYTSEYNGVCYNPDYFGHEVAYAKSDSSYEDVILEYANHSNKIKKDRRTEERVLYQQNKNDFFIREIMAIRRNRRPPKYFKKYMRYKNIPGYKIIDSLT